MCEASSRVDDLLVDSKLLFAFVDKLLVTFIGACGLAGLAGLSADLAAIHGLITLLLRHGRRGGPV